MARGGGGGGTDRDGQTQSHKQEFKIGFQCPVNHDGYIRAKQRKGGGGNRPTDRLTDT